MRLLGYADPRPMVISPEQWRQRLHPEEGIASNCRYQLTLELPQWGDSIEDVLRIRLENGEYARFALHGTVLERDADGHARELAGEDSLTPVQFWQSEKKVKDREDMPSTT